VSANAPCTDNKRTIVDGKRTIVGNEQKDMAFTLWYSEFMRPVEERNEEQLGIDRTSLLQSQEFLQSLPCLSLAGFMVTFGGVHFNLFSLGKQDFKMGFSAHKNMCWYGREQMGT
jgi:hypothetical protein